MSISQASVGRQPAPNAIQPRLLHSLHQRNNSVLSLTADETRLFSGSQAEEISVWSKKTFQHTDTLQGHTGSVLALVYSAKKKWLFSSSGDSTVIIWNTIDLTPVYVLNPYLDTEAGDLFSLAWNPLLQTIYIGCQNTSIQWFNFTDLPDSASPTSGTSTPSRKAHKFFDSYPQYEHKAADCHAKNRLARGSLAGDTDGCMVSALPPEAESLHVPASNVIYSEHYGYVYCMTLLRPSKDSPDDMEGRMCQLLTGSGDETVKLWKCLSSGPSLLHTFRCAQGAVLSIAVRSEIIFAGCQDGHVKVWDLETKTPVRTIIVQEGIDILSLSVIHSDLYTCSANGQVQRWSASFDCTASWVAHDKGIILSSLVTEGDRDLCLITGGNDDYVKVWEVSIPDTGEQPSEHAIESPSNVPSDTMTSVLSKFVSIPSVSSDPSHREDCRQAAIWLKKCLNQLGAESTLLPTGEETNPLVLATFCGTKSQNPHPRLLFYGHYDVISASPADWISDPFTLCGRNGYLYGRGVTDNKGPIMAVACAAADLLSQRALCVDLVFLIEGAEEVGSPGLSEAVKKYKDLIGRVDAILISNSTWIAEEPPCITYGLRGVIQCAIEVSNNRPDLHSGVEGGAVVEPMVDMVKLLASLTDDQHRVKIPKFYDRVRPQSEDEKQSYTQLAAITQRPLAALSSMWREPSLTIHGIDASGPKNPTIIPRKVKSEVSLRIVPDQNLDDVASSLCDHLKASFESLKSPNTLQVTVEHTADWWLGNLDDQYFNALECAVEDEWGVKPLRIREGGSIPSVPFLEKEFGCCALHLPLGQSSDQAHLPNERISYSNLCRGKSVIEKFLRRMARKETSNPLSFPDIHVLG